MNVGMPPRSRNHRLPAACDAPTVTAASSLVTPRPISRQNLRSTSRRSVGFPGDFIEDLPVNAFIHPAGLPINTSTIKVLRRPVESALRAAIGADHGADRSASPAGHLERVDDQFGLVHVEGRVDQIGVVEVTGAAGACPPLVVGLGGETQHPTGHRHRHAQRRGGG
jgi:hypothetical protein